MEVKAYSRTLYIPDNWDENPKIGNLMNILQLALQTKDQDSNETNITPEEIKELLMADMIVHIGEIEDIQNPITKLTYNLYGPSSMKAITDRAFIAKSPYSINPDVDEYAVKIEADKEFNFADLPTCPTYGDFFIIYTNEDMSQDKKMFSYTTGLQSATVIINSFLTGTAAIYLRLRVI